MIVAFAGAAYSGKDTAARLLARRHGFYDIALASAFKSGAAFMYGLTQSQVNGESKDIVDPFWGVTPRRILQQVANHGRAMFGDDVWVRALRRFIDARGGVNARRWVITDVRTLAEAVEIASWGGKVALIVRPPVGRLVGDAATDPTERDFLQFVGWSGTIDNSGTLEQFEHSVTEFLRAQVPEVLKPHTVTR